jgi:hypothetical protein
MKTVIKNSAQALCPRAIETRGALINTSLQRGVSATAILELFQQLAGPSTKPDEIRQKRPF